MGYWLFKSEASCFSFDDLRDAPDATTGWDGVRNYQARNFLRDQVKGGDLVLYYHSNAEPPGIAGIAEVVREGHPDPTAFDPSADHYDPKGGPDDPIWYQVSIRAVRPVEPMLPLARLRGEPRLKGLELLRKGSRLSVMPVEPEHWAVIAELIASPADAPEAPESLSKSKPTRKARRRLS